MTAVIQRSERKERAFRVYVQVCVCVCRYIKVVIGLETHASYVSSGAPRNKTFLLPEQSSEVFDSHGNNLSEQRRDVKAIDYRGAFGLAFSPRPAGFISFP